MFDITVVYVSVLTPSSGPIHLPLFIPPTVFLALFFLRFTLNRSLISSRVSRFGETNCLAFALTREVVTLLITHSPPVTLFFYPQLGKALTLAWIAEFNTRTNLFYVGNRSWRSGRVRSFRREICVWSNFFYFFSCKVYLCLISRLWPAWGNTNFFDEIGLFFLK